MSLFFPLEARNFFPILRSLSYYVCPIILNVPLLVPTALLQSLPRHDGDGTARRLPPPLRPHPSHQVTRLHAGQDNHFKSILERYIKRIYKETIKTI